MKHAVCALLSIVACSLPVSAAADCFRYDYAEVELAGVVVLKAPAQALKGEHRNPGEQHAFLKLDRPLCIAPGKNSHEGGENNQSEVTLYTLKGNGLGSLAGKHVAVRGVLMHSFVADSHTAMQFVVNDIVEAAR